MNPQRDVVFLGLSITSSWRNGHAANYRALAKAMRRRGHRVLFLERDVPWYACRRDLPSPPWCELGLYDGVEEARESFGQRVREADLVVLGSLVPDGVAIAEWLLSEARGVRAFYDLDTPRTMALVESGEGVYVQREQLPRFDLYLSSSGGAVLETLHCDFGARRPRAFYRCIDPELHQPLGDAPVIDLGFLETDEDVSLPALESLLVDPARRRPRARFSVAGSCGTHASTWPANIQRIERLAPTEHARFYGRQRFTLNLTPPDMAAAGWSPSVRLFEAAACCVPVITDDWPGLSDLFSIGEEILVAIDARDVLATIDGLSEKRRQSIARRARERVLAQHTAEQRVIELEAHLASVTRSSRRPLAASARA